MNLKSPKQIIRSLFQKHSEKLDNVVYADKLFIINTIVNYLFKDKDYRTLDKTKIVEYGELINQYLADEVDIYWKDGTLMVVEKDDAEHLEGD